MKKQIMEYWWLILLSVTAGVAGQTAIKLGVSQPGASDAAGSLGGLVGMILGSPLVILGLGLYGLGALAWIAVLSRMDLSLAYPFLALNFVLVALVSRFYLGEYHPRDALGRHRCDLHGHPACRPQQFSVAACAHAFFAPNNRQAATISLFPRRAAPQATRGADLDRLAPNAYRMDTILVQAMTLFSNDVVQAMTLFRQ